MFASQHIPYSKTNAFTNTVIDYLEDSGSLRPFYKFRPDMEGLAKALEERKNINTDRESLVAALKKQYKERVSIEAVNKNIGLLEQNQSFTICTAHQPNLFTGPLYFLYKILHAIKLAAHLKATHPQFDFVPVYYMGSEDADLEELNHLHIRGKRYEWKTGQKGAVGRMKTDNDIQSLLAEMESQLGVELFGKEVIDMLRSFHQNGRTIQEATLDLVHALFGNYGLVVIIPDAPEFKRQMKAIFEDDLFRQVPAGIVGKTSEKLSAHYHAQAFPRPINLFYLKDDIRERIEKTGDKYCVCHTDIVFSEEALRTELKEHPERFSPNVILRGIFQETILPNLAFIGGGGELAYWLQLKDLFEHYGVPFPVLVLRNSFLIVDANQAASAKKLELGLPELFENELQLLNRQLEKAGKKPQLNGEVKQLESIYEALKKMATSVDPTLDQHVDALKTRSMNALTLLEKKMLRAERKKHEATARQISRLKEQLFPGNSLQERKENFAGFYARWGRTFIDQLLSHSLAIEQQFCILSES
jgi:bacillithiol biosynthesis cysteine-adding enzyme BshC